MFPCNEDESLGVRWSVVRDHLESLKCFGSIIAPVFLIKAQIERDFPIVEKHVFSSSLRDLLPKEVFHSKQFSVSNSL